MIVWEITIQAAARPNQKCIYQSPTIRLTLDGISIRQAKDKDKFDAIRYLFSLRIS